MKEMIENQKKYFYTGATKSYHFRKKQLQQLKKMLNYYENEIYDALKLDLNKSKHETLTTELGILYTEIEFTLKHLQTWMKKQRVERSEEHTSELQSRCNLVC